MSLDSNDTLLAVLRRTGLLAPEQVDEIARELVPEYADPQSLGGYLVQIDWLTGYQLQLLVSGQWDDLTLGPYQILDRLGEGGISEVFKAWDTARGRVVALKVLHRHLSSNADVLRQLQREVQAITCLSHPNIVKTFDASRSGSVNYFAMEFVEGMDLDRYVRQVGPLSVEQACEYTRQVAQGLQHAHQNGLVHRDIKPANLFLVHPPLPSQPSPSATMTTTTNGSAAVRRGPDPVVKVIDWGLARCFRDPDETAPELDLDARSEAELDAEKGCLIGTADYIAPEQACDPTLVDTRADIYSLGCSLYYLLTGRPPFQGTTLMQKLLQHQEVEPPSLKQQRPDVPDELDALVRRMMAKQPEARLQIPLLVVAGLRKFCAAGAYSANGACARPGSWASLARPTPAPGTVLNLPRPATHTSLERPSTHPSLARPGDPPPGASPESSLRLSRPGGQDDSSSGGALRK